MESTQPTPARTEKPFRSILATVPVELRIEAPEEDKIARALFPTDTQCSVRSRSRRSVMHPTGRGFRDNQSEVANASLDLTLYDQIKLSGASDLTAAEARQYINALLQCEVTDIARSVDRRYHITFACKWGVVEAILTTPSAADLLDFQSRFYSVSPGQLGASILKTYLEPGGEVFDKRFLSACFLSSPLMDADPDLLITVPSAADIPLVYKATCIAALKSHIDDRLEFPGLGAAPANFS